MRVRVLLRGEMRVGQSGFRGFFGWDDRLSETVRTLILMRHAKSGWGAADLPDHARTLNDQGRSEARLAAEWLSAAALLPQILLASTATRCRETVATLCDAWNDPPPAYFSDDLYLAPPETMLRSIRSDALDHERVMLVAHNPGLAALAQLLSGQSLPMPTAGIVALRLRIDSWQDLRIGSPVVSFAAHRPEPLER